MKTIDLFSQGLNDFSSLQKEDLSNVFILHGIVHWFMDEFDLGQQVFRDYLSESNPSLAISLTPKELILDAYERHLFVDESVVERSVPSGLYGTCRGEGAADYPLLCTCFRVDDRSP